MSKYAGRPAPPLQEHCRITDEGRPGGICGDAAGYLVRVKTRTTDAKVPACHKHWSEHNKLAAAARANRH